MSSAVISGHQRSSSWAAMGTPDEGGKSGPSVAIRIFHLARGFDSAMSPPLNVACSTRTWKVLARDRVQRAEHAFEADARRDVERMHIREEGRRATCIGMPYNTRDESAIISTKSVEPQQRLLVRPPTTHSDQKGDPGANAVWSERSNPGASALSTACASSGGGGLSGAEVSDSWYRSTAGESLQMKPPRRRRWAASGSWSSRWHSKRMSRSRDRERSSRAREGTLSKIARKRRMAM